MLQKTIGHGFKCPYLNCRDRTFTASLPGVLSLSQMILAERGASSCFTASDKHPCVSRSLRSRYALTNANSAGLRPRNSSSRGRSSRNRPAVFAASRAIPRRSISRSYSSGFVTLRCDSTIPHLIEDKTHSPIRSLASMNKPPQPCDQRPPQQVWSQLLHVIRVSLDRVRSCMLRRFLYLHFQLVWTPNRRFGEITV